MKCLILSLLVCGVMIALVSSTCVDDPCQNGATCAVVGGVDTCTCAAGYSGTNCTDDIDDCANNPCENGGTCADDGVSQFNCTCLAEYNGATCHLMGADDCTPTPCLNGGTCTDGNSTFTCACATGYSGENCSTDACTSSPCMNGATCSMGVSTAVCACSEEFTGATCDAIIGTPEPTTDTPPSTTTRSGACVSKSCQSLLWVAFLTAAITFIQH